MANDYIIGVGDTTIEATSVVNNVAIYNVTVDVIKYDTIRGPTGNVKTLVTIVNDMPCSIKWTSAKERAMFKKTTQFIDALLRCRKPAGVTITNANVVEYNDKAYEITGVEDVNNLHTLLILGLRKVK